jgi:hypothetical protein
LDVEVIDSSLNIVEQFWQHNNHDEVATGLTHPGCGGEFIARSNSKVAGKNTTTASSEPLPAANSHKQDRQSVA